MPLERIGAMDRVALGVAALSVVDRAVKLALMSRFFARRLPEEPASWPTVTMLESVTRGSSGLRANLEARTRLEYAARVRRVLICDAGDARVDRDLSRGRRGVS